MNRKKPLIKGSEKKSGKTGLMSGRKSNMSTRGEQKTVDTNGDNPWLNRQPINNSTMDWFNKRNESGKTDNEELKHRDTDKRKLNIMNNEEWAMANNRFGRYNKGRQ